MRGNTTIFGSGHGFPGRNALRGKGASHGLGTDADKHEDGPVTDPLGAKRGDARVRRGGSAYNVARDARSARRASLSPDIPQQGVGLRFACVQPL